MNASSSNNFASLPITEAQLANLESLGYAEMTPIQARSLPLILDGKDLIARAKTGSGKTAAFGLGLLHHIEPGLLSVQALVLCPTRELAEQVAGELRRLAQGIPNIKLTLLCGGKPTGPQKSSLQHGTHIAVGTPGRLLDHLQRGSLQLRELKTLVLDEADRMLDMGFSEDVSQIVGHAPRKRQTLLFSATYPEAIRKISRRFQREPVTVTVEADHQPGVIKQLFYQARKHERNNTLLALFESYQLEGALVFCHTKKQCSQVADFLNQHRIQALAIHGDLEQRERDRVLVQFANNSCPVLVGTDVAARGLDIKSLPAVINYELPHDPEIYVHRIGRTGRAGERGLALSIFTEAEQVRLNAIESYLSEPGVCDVLASLDRDPGYELKSAMATIELAAGRRHKIRAGDLLGALTGDAGLPGSSIGKIDIADQRSYVAVQRTELKKALRFLAEGKVKGRRIRAFSIG